MKRLLPAYVLLALAAGACENPSGSGPRVEQVVITPQARNLNAGDSYQLSAQALGGNGQVVSNAQISWQSLENDVATVTQTGLVTGLRTGTARIVASAGQVADTAVITVFGTAAECDAPGAGLNLAVGQAVQRRGTAAVLLCLDGGTSGAEYLVTPFYGARDAGSSVTVRVDPAGTAPAAGPPSPSLAPFSVAGGLALTDGGASRGPDGGFHARLNERARGALALRVAAARQAYQARRQGGARFQTSAAPPAIGTLLQLNVETDGHPCTATDYRTGRVVAVSNRAVVVADTANPAGGFTEANYQHVAATFDTLVWPVNVAAFGEPADVDQNGRVVIFYTRAVNELTPANVTYVVGGFFYGRDLFPRTNDPAFGGACTGSNFAEMFYLLAPDPTGVVNGNVRTTASVLSSTNAVVGHEFQHLISASRRLYLVPGVTGTNWNEAVWLNEGLSHIAEELLFYRRAQASPRNNLGSGILATGSLTRQAFVEFGQQNYGRYGEYLKNPEGTAPYQDDDDLGTRGAAWAFLRYVADHRAGDDQTLWRSLVNSPLVGLDNLEAVLQVDPIPLVRDFTVSLYTDDSGVPVQPVFTQPSWNHRSLFQTISGSYPLLTRTLVSGSPVNVPLVAGGASFLRGSVPAGKRGSVRMTTAGSSGLSPDVWVTVVRTK